jgi:hypothetical protein
MEPPGALATTMRTIRSGQFAANDGTLAAPAATTRKPAKSPLQIAFIALSVESY